MSYSIQNISMKMHFITKWAIVYGSSRGSRTCFSFGPTFRAEKSKTRRHLIEFWMIEPEMAFTNHAESLEIQEHYVSHIVQSVLNHCQLELKALDRDTTKLEKLLHLSLEFLMMMLSNS